MATFDPISDPVPLDDGSTSEPPLTPRELRRLRGVLVELDRQNWARKKLAYLLPLLTAIVVGAWQVYDWIAKHIRLAP